MGDCQLSEKIAQREQELKSSFDKILVVEEQYKELGAIDQDIEDKIQNLFVQASNISGQMKTTLGQYTPKAF